ncbi:MAG: 4-hydroxy-tetrahydrodipicolinate synthase [Firmicutes bacterium]|nr:4-hydroxy-tetrahydrodipicolinate synthase [Bacillota bacterium]
MSIFTGSGVAIATPFTKDFQINYDEFARLIEFQIANGTDAIIACGTTGEASTMTDEEQIRCVRFAVDVVNGRIPVLAGAGSNDTAHGVELAKGCAKAGVDGLLLVTPYYNKTTQKGLIEHFNKIANNVDVPIILYSVPGRTGLNITPSTCLKLSETENIIGIKEASGNLSQVAEIASLCGPDFDIYSGNDDQILPVLSLGGKGVVSVLANVAPQYTHDMTQKFFEGKVKEAAEMQVKAIDLINSLFCEVNPIPVKAALNMIGFDAGIGRMPLTSMEEANYKRLEASMRNFGLIK